MLTSIAVFHSFLQWNSFPLYRFSKSIYSFPCRWTFGVLSVLLYHKLSCYEHSCFYLFAHMYHPDCIPARRKEKREGEELAPLPSMQRSLHMYPVGQNVVGWPHLASKEAGKCSSHPGENSEEGLRVNCLFLPQGFMPARKKKNVWTECNYCLPCSV